VERTLNCTIHRYFYEKVMDYETFNDCWKDAVESIEKVKELIYESLKRCDGRRRAIILIIFVCGSKKCLNFCLNGFSVNC